MERSAFEQKARTWREKALNVSRHYGAGEDMAEDIAQDVMLRLWQMHDELEQFRSVEAIVTLMAKHTLRDLQRRRTAESLEEATIVSLTSSPQEELEAKENCPPRNAPYYICAKRNGGATKRLPNYWESKRHQ